MVTFRKKREKKDAYVNADGDWPAVGAVVDVEAKLQVTS